MRGYYKCPNTGDIINCVPQADQVPCFCGKANPIASPGLAHIEVRDGIHFTCVLDESTMVDYEKQRLQKVEAFRGKKADPPVILHKNDCY